MIKKLTRTTAIPALFIRITVGLIFLSEGLQKFITPEATGVGRFTKIDFGNPAFWAFFTGSFEVVCGTLVLIGFMTRLAAIPLLIIMLVAFVTTKVPVLAGKGFWTFAHEYRTDFAMTMLLLYLLAYGGGSHSIDKKFAQTQSKYNGTANQ